MHVEYLIKELYSMTLEERRLILLVSAKHGASDEEVSRVTSISEDDWVEVFGTADIPAYTIMSDAADTLLHRAPTSMGSKNHVVTLQWISSVSFFPCVKVLAVALSPTVPFMFSGLKIGDEKFNILAGLKKE